jgi:hypothetical protein
LLHTTQCEGYARGRKNQKKKQKIRTKIRGERKRKETSGMRRRRRIFLVFVSLLRFSGYR